MEKLNSENLIQHKLHNGLTIQLKEIHTAPIISTWIWYKVGSRYEVPGKTGLSHWVEHMQFKGTPNFPPGVLDKAISRIGGNWNAFTYLDWTTYFETLPANNFEVSLELEADRMTNSLFLPEEVERERTVVMSEREGSENNPLFLLNEAVQLATFVTHPYRFDVGGVMEDLQTISRDDLYNHYKNYYQPGNAILSICGDFESQTILKKVDNYFGKLTSTKTKIPNIQPEPIAFTEKHVDISGPGETTYLQIVYHSPKANSDDFFALTILDSLLSGPSGLNMFGSGGTSNKTSRLYLELVENEIAVSAYGSIQATIDPYLYDLHLTVHPNKTPEKVINVVDDQIHKLQDEKVSQEEISRAVKQARALFAYGSENITNQAFWMGYSEIFATYDWFINYVEKLSNVSPEDIQRIAQKYLQEKNRVIGIYHPENNQEANQ